MHFGTFVICLAWVLLICLIFYGLCADPIYNTKQPVYSDIIDVESIQPYLPTAAKDITTRGNGWISYTLTIDNKEYLFMQKDLTTNPIVLGEK